MHAHERLVNAIQLQNRVPGDDRVELKKLWELEALTPRGRHKHGLDQYLVLKVQLPPL